MEEEERTYYFYAFIGFELSKTSQRFICLACEE